MPDIKLATAQGWTLTACHDGERWSLHVENDFRQSASLTAAVNEGEVFDKRGDAVPLKASALKLFERWHDQYDDFTAEAEKRSK